MSLLAVRPLSQSRQLLVVEAVHGASREQVEISRRLLLQLLAANATVMAPWILKHETTVAVMVHDSGSSSGGPCRACTSWNLWSSAPGETTALVTRAGKLTKKDDCPPKCFYTRFTGSSEPWRAVLSDALRTITDPPAVAQAFNVRVAQQLPQTSSPRGDPTPIPLCFVAHLEDSGLVRRPLRHRTGIKTGGAWAVAYQLVSRHPHPPGASPTSPCSPNISRPASQTALLLGPGHLPSL